MIGEPPEPRSARHPRRILYVDHTADLGGGEIALLHLAANVDRHRFTPIVVLSSHGALETQLQAAGVQTHVLPLNPYILAARKDSLGLRSAMRVGSILRLVLYALQLARFIRAHAIDVVHTNSLKSDVFGGLAARLAGVSVIWHLRDRIAEDYLPPFIVHVFRLLGRCVPNFVIANSAATLATLRLPRSTSSAVVYSGRRPCPISTRDVAIDARRLLAEPATRRRNRQPRIGLVGRITPWKGQHVFIRAAQQVLAVFPEAQFEIVGSAQAGDETYEAELHRLVAVCGMEQQMSFLGFRPDVDAVVASLDVLVHASTLPEPFGQVVIDGMAAGTPVIATRGGGIIEIIDDGVTGVLVGMGCIDEMAAAIVGLVCEPERAARMATAARAAFLKRFTLDTTLEGIHAVYEKLCPRV